MKIELQSPFKELYKSGYLNINKEPRRLVLLVREDNSQTTVSYARYLMSVHLGRLLDKSEHVDHIDDDKMNDVIENFQILTPTENNQKKVKALGIETKPITLIYPICNEKFTRPRRNIVTKLSNGKTPTCSRTCGGKYSHLNK